MHRQIVTTLMPGFLGTTLPEWLAERLRDGLGAVCIFGQNIASATQLRELTAAIREANPLAVIAIDEEGGDVTRLHYSSGSPYPGNAILGRLNDLSYTEEVGRMVGWELRKTGCTLTFAPDVDINSNADNPVIGVRSFGTDPERVAAHSAAWVRGLQGTGIAASPKHFPGHGDTALDSHLALPIVDVSLEMLRERELLPFRAAIEAGSKTIMTSHILLPQIDAVNPTTFSRQILGGLLRAELGFDGVIVSDALDMIGASGERGIPAAAAAALAAGCDLLCIGTENTAEQLDAIEAAVRAAVDDGVLSKDRLADAAQRVRQFAAETTQDFESIPITEYAQLIDEPCFDTSRVIDSFDLSINAHTWLAAAHPAFSVVRLETVNNIAVGDAPWGPCAEVAAHPTSPLGMFWNAQPTVTVTEGESTELVLAARMPVVVIGKANHRYPFAREIIDRLRAEGRQVLVIDMGWPADDRAYADIATFGASRLVGRALLERLAR
ncbi:beta-N-acetylhexosaminidase [Glaciibacter psychrotolerans]|uniref:Beta-N-acetylhexosaminidase n=1 Tax=Glaciibacter psychrotolerans TaxID=670054 RepID=A0A7Z0J7I2_9MICO|nr:beta-N-acetylhexosaminidase [Leifsonia psychrotolerans]